MNPELHIAFNREQFNLLFPFHLVLDTDCRILSAGESLRKLCPSGAYTHFSSEFVVKRPYVEAPDFSALLALQNQLVVIESHHDKSIVLRGQLEPLQDDGLLLFVGSPWFGSMDQVRAKGLTLHDFAIHDAMIDLLHVLKTQEITTNEIKQLLTTVNRQKDKLKQSEANYRSIVEMATDIIYKTNQAGYFTFVNAVAERITGYSREELLQMHFLDIIRPDYRNRTQGFYAHQVINDIPTTYYEFPIRTKSGAERWIGQSVQYPQSGNEALELTALAMDITERKHAEINLAIQEEKYRNILANMNLGLLEVDNDDVIQYANQSFCAMSGYSLEELIGNTAADLLVDAENRPVIMERNGLRQQGISDVYHIQVRNKAGELRWWVVSGAPRYNDEGVLVGSVGIHLDVTEQKHMEEELHIARQKAEESSKAKETFLATMSHEIRTPLNAIIGITNLMRLESRPVNYREHLDILSFAANNLLSLITDILDWSKIEAGKIEFSNNPFDLRELLNGILRTFQPKCEEKKIGIELRYTGDVPPRLSGDTLRLTQIINNLVNNAVKFTHKGGVRITVSPKYLPNGMLRLQCEVTDTGIGIARNRIANIFNAFEQAGSNILTRYGGSGLGLHITRQLIELQGGTITVASKLHQGSTFTFTLDFGIPPAGKKQKTALQEKGKQPAGPLQGKDILVVEDNDANQKIAASYLRHWGATPHLARHGAEALGLLSLRHYDLVLVDLFMPVMDGFETIRRIRKHKKWKALPLVALTASAETSLMEKALSLGADTCLTKPFNPDQLHDTLSRLLLEDGTGALPATKLLEPDTTTHDRPWQYIRLDQLEAAALGSETFVREMLGILAREIPALLSEAATQLDAQENTAFASTIHKLKNNLLLLGLDPLREPLRFAEEHARENTRLPEVAAAFDTIQAYWSLAETEVHAVLEHT